MTEEKVDTDVTRIAQAKEWFVLFGARRGTPVYIGDRQSWQEFHPSSGIRGFAPAGEVLTVLGLTIDDTPFVQTPVNWLEYDEAIAAKAKFSDFERPRKASIHEFSARYGMVIRFFVLKISPEDGVTLFEQYINGK